MLAAAKSDQDRKNMIGERLYPLIASIAEAPGKITGMLLEAMDPSELLNLLHECSLLLELLMGIGVVSGGCRRFVQ